MIKHKKDSPYILENTNFASGTVGEMFFTKPSPSDEKSLINLGTFNLLIGGILRILKNIKSVFNDKKKFILAIVIVIIWLIITLLPMFKINGKFLSYLNFFLFATGGTHSGLIGTIAGTIGKGFFAYFVTLLILPIFSRKMPFKGLGTGLKAYFNLFKGLNKKSSLPLILGVGISLIIYNFLVGKASLQNSMFGITSFILTLIALSKKSGFFRKFILSIVKNKKSEKTLDTSYLNKIMGGFATGFALSIPLSTTGFIFIGYFIGISLIVATIILKISSSKDKSKEAV